MKRIARIIVWLTSLALAAIATVVARHPFDQADFAAIAIGGRVQLCAARERTISITLSNYKIVAPVQRRIVLGTTTWRSFDGERFIAGTQMEFGRGGFRLALGDRRIGNSRVAEAMQIEFPQWMLVVPLILLAGRWYCRVCIRSARVERGECVACGYDLRGSTMNRCSECGRVTCQFLRRNKG